MGTRTSTASSSGRARSRTGTWREALASAVALAVLTGTMAVAMPASGAQRPALTSFGAPMGRFQANYPKDRTGCNATNCYGPAMSSSSARYEFTYVSTMKGRVDGYDQALRRGTPLLQAELQVAELFPPDVTMNSFYVKRHDAYGNSCVFYDLSSKTVAQIFGKAAFGNTDGNVGVELATMLGNGTTTFNPDNIDLALVVPTYLSSQDNC